MSKALNKKSSIALILLSVAALLGQAFSWLIWPVVRSFASRMLVQYIGFVNHFTLKNILFWVVYVIAYAVPLVVLAVYGILRMKSYKWDTALVAVYALLPAAFLLRDAVNILFFYGWQNLAASALSLLTDIGFLLACLLAAVLCLCKVRNRVAVIPVVVLGALTAINLFVLPLNGNIAAFAFEFFNGVVYAIPLVLTLVAVVLAGTGRKPLVAEIAEEPAEAVAE